MERNPVETENRTTDDAEESAVDVQSADGHPESGDQRPAQAEKGVPDVDGDTAGNVDGGARGVRRPKALAATIVVSLVLVVLLAAGGGVLWYVRAQHSYQERDAAITVAARQAVLALLTLDPKNVQESVDKVLAGATGRWRQEFSKQAEQFTKMIPERKVRSDATITDSAIQSADDDRATVLVSANAAIRNVDSPKGYPGVYRALMELERQGDRWLVSDLQLVA